MPGAGYDIGASLSSSTSLGSELTAPLSFSDSSTGKNLSDSFLSPGASQGLTSLQLIVISVAVVLGIGAVLFLVFELIKK